jgi:hypothetical protein
MVQVITQHKPNVGLYYLPGQEKFQLQVSSLSDVYILFNANQWLVQQIYLEGKVCFGTNVK